MGDIVDYDSKTIDFTKKKATSMKCNQRVRIIDPSIEDIETKRDNLKIELILNQISCNWIRSDEVS